MKPLHSTILASIGGVCIALGLASPAFELLLPLGGLAFFAGLTETLGRMAFPAERRILRWLFGLLGALALVSVAGTIVYDLYRLDSLGWSWLLVTLPWAVFAFTPLTRLRRDAEERQPVAPIEKTAPEDSLSALLLIIAFLSDAAALRWLVAARTLEALRSPWEAVSPIFFLWITLATFCLAALAYRKRFPHLALIAATVHLFTLLSPALLVYGFGYGFDPFVHQAAERLVAATGVVLPKTPFYIGQYALVTLVSKVFSLPVDAVDRAILPVISGLFLPAAAAWLLRRGFGAQRSLAILASFGVLLLPLSAFASTTPQGLADFFFLLTVIFGSGWLHAHRPPLGYVLILAGASAAAHPLAGIPALMATALLMIVKLRHDGVPGMRIVKTSAYAILLFSAALAVPVVLSARQGTVATSVAAAFRKPATEILSGIPFRVPRIETRYLPILDFAELVNRGRDALLIVMAAVGAWLLARRGTYRRTALASGGLAIALFAATALLRAGVIFPGVISYEQSDYADRLYQVALLALSPLVIAAFALWWRALGKTDASVRFAQTLLFAGVVSALAYGWFPRLDAYGWSRGFSASIHDQHAVAWIDADATSPYVVLADQSVSAAALKAYGFRTYYGDQFYYSIPTGAPLYQHYLRMVHDAAPREEMLSAMSEIGVPSAYFVIDKYWTDAPMIVEAAKKTADSWHAIDGGELYVFKYSSFR